MTTDIKPKIYIVPLRTWIKEIIHRCPACGNKLLKYECYHCKAKIEYKLLMQKKI